MSRTEEILTAHSLCDKTYIWYLYIYIYTVIRCVARVSVFSPALSWLTKHFIIIIEYYSCIAMCWTLAVCFWISLIKEYKKITYLALAVSDVDGCWSLSLSDSGRCLWRIIRHKITAQHPTLPSTAPPWVTGDVGNCWLFVILYSYMRWSLNIYYIIFCKCN